MKTLLCFVFLFHLDWEKKANFGIIKTEKFNYGWISALCLECDLDTAGQSDAQENRAKVFPGVHTYRYLTKAAFEYFIDLWWMCQSEIPTLNRSDGDF